MREGYIVVREEEHLDPKFWVCDKLEDAGKIFHDVSAYWIDKYSDHELDSCVYGENLFQAGTEEAGFNVYVSKQQIREKGEFRQNKK